MHIIWKGQSCFHLLTAQKKGEQTSIIIDPFDESIGLRPLNLVADVLLITHHHRDHDNIKTIKGAPFIIDSPGEYEIKNIFIQGIPAFHDNVGGKKRGKITIFTIEIEETRICHLGDLGQKELTSDQLDKIGDVDILMVPVGGAYTIDGTEASKIISQIEPKVVIPMHYRIPKLKIKLDTIDKFLGAMGIRSIEPQNKLLIKKKDLPTEEMRVIVLKS